MAETNFNQNHISRLKDLQALAQRTKSNLDTSNQRITQLETKTSGIDALQATVDTLNGAATVAGSVKKQVADAVAGIVNGAPEDYDTLKEMSDWLSGHEKSAATMNSAINTNTNGLAELKKTVDALPGQTDTKLAAYSTTVDMNTAIDKKIADAEKSYYTSSEMDEKVGALVAKADITTDAEVKAMLDEVFGVTA